MDPPLQAALRSKTDASAVSLTDYRGSTTAARYGDLRTEFDAMRRGWGGYDLGFRAKISLTGGDRVRWLNGMVTNNIRDLAQNHGVYAFLLNPQGRILGDMVAYNRGESLMVDTDRAQVEKLLATFDHYIIMDDVEVKDLGDKLKGLGVRGPTSRAILQGAELKIPELKALQTFSLQCDCECGCLDCTIVRGEDSAHEAYEIWVAPQFVEQLWNALLAAGA